MIRDNWCSTFALSASCRKGKEKREESIKAVIEVCIGWRRNFVRIISIQGERETASRGGQRRNT